MESESKTVLSRSDADFLLSTALDVAVQTLRAGGEIHRVEETVERICYAHGAVHVEVFAISSLVLSTIRMADGSYSTQNRRVLAIENHMTRLSRLNHISRRLVAHEITLSEAQEEVRRAKRASPYPMYMELLGSFLCAGGFAVMFGGAGLDALAAALIGLLMMVTAKLLPSSTNPFAVMVLTSLLGGIATSVAVYFGLGASRGVIFVGMIMPLVPGLAFGNALRDLLSGDLLSGTLSLIRSLLLAASIAFGLFLSTMLTRGLISEPTPYIVDERTGALIHIVMLLAALCGTVAYMLILRLEKKHILPAAIGGLLTYGLYYLLYYHTSDLFLSNFAGALLAAIYAYILAIIFRTPATVFHTASLIPLVPGGMLYYTMDAMIQGDFPAVLRHGGDTLRVGLGIAAGIVLGGIAMRLLRSARSLLKKDYF